MVAKKQLHSSLIMVCLAATFITNSPHLSHIPPIEKTQFTLTTTTDQNLSDTLATSDTALVIGGSTIPVPTQRYVDTLSNTFLKPLGFQGELQTVFTPEGLYPITGQHSLTLNNSMEEGQEILIHRITEMYDRHEFSAAHPLTVFGWSQSAIISSDIMQTLHDQGIPSEDIHFVLIGDVVAPNGGFFPRFEGDDPAFPALGIDFSQPTPNTFYPTDVFTDEYDLFADFPRYTLDFISDLNAFFGVLAHVNYLGETPQQISDAVPLVNSDPDGMTHYFEIPTTTLPLLEPLQLIPGIGQPLYDLLEPDTKILVDLGYGSLSHGWDPNPANEWSPVAAFPPLNPLTVMSALLHGADTGINNMMKQVMNSDNWSISTILNSPLLTTLVNMMHTLGFTNATTAQEMLNHPELAIKNIGEFLHSTANYPIDDISIWNATPDQVINDLTATLEADYSALLPMLDSATTLFITIPEMAASIALYDLSEGHIINGLLAPLTIAQALIPFDGLYAAVAPIGEATLGTVLNIADLAGFGDSTNAPNALSPASIGDAPALEVDSNGVETADVDTGDITNDADFSI